MLILDSTREVMKSARHVSIDAEAVARWARETPASALVPKGHELAAHLPGSQTELANLVLLIDALNFCFWSGNPLRFEWRGRTYERFNAMFVSLMLAARCDPAWFHPEYWVRVPTDEIRAVLQGRHELLLMEERERIIRETGRILIERFDGWFMHAVESVGGRAWPLAVLLMTEFDSFRDVAGYRGKIVYFMKRAQITALDLSVAWQTHGHSPLAGLEELTAFADYRVPQALRRLGILKVSDDLAKRVEEEKELPEGGEEEVEIRAATICAVDDMVRARGRAGRPPAAWEIDWYLWELARGPDVTLKHHRTRTVFY